MKEGLLPREDGMFLRAICVAAIACLPLLSGCSGVGLAKPIDAPPAFKFKNFERLTDEFAWFYADAQDMFFGVDYYEHMESRFGSCPYR